MNVKHESEGNPLQKNATFHRSSTADEFLIYTKRYGRDPFW